MAFLTSISYRSLKYNMFLFISGNWMIPWRHTVICLVAVRLLQWMTQCSALASKISSCASQTCSPLIGSTHWRFYGAIQTTTKTTSALCSMQSWYAIRSTKWLRCRHECGLRVECSGSIPLLSNL